MCVSVYLCVQHVSAYHVHSSCLDNNYLQTTASKFHDMALMYVGSGIHTVKPNALDLHCWDANSLIVCTCRPLV